MSFDVPADAYLRFMGRWSEPLAGVFLESADVGVTGQVLDVGCGPGVLTAVLVDRYGAPAVAAIDPSPSFVAATRRASRGWTSGRASPRRCRTPTTPSTPRSPSWSCTSCPTRWPASATWAG